MYCLPSVVKSTETEACANACKVLKHLSHDANQPTRKFRSPDERWKSSNNRLSTAALSFCRACSCASPSLSRFARTQRSSTCCPGYRAKSLQISRTFNALSAHLDSGQMARTGKRTIVHCPRGIPRHFGALRVRLFSLSGLERAYRLNSPTLGKDIYCWFASDVTAAMLVVNKKSISLRWEMNSILMQI